jgi:hypothetical protein
MFVWLGNEELSLHLFLFLGFLLRLVYLVVMGMQGDGMGDKGHDVVWVNSE